MSDADTLFVRIAVLRREIADLADTLTDTQLATPSLCQGWDVRTAIAHLTVLPTVSKLRFAVAGLRNRGDLARAIDSLTRTAAAAPAAEIAATLRENADSRATPPMAGPTVPLADLVAHSADIRIPLGLPFSPDAADAAVTLEFLASAPTGFMPKRRLDGIRLVASDLDRSWGSGSELSGTAADLIVSVIGRPVALDRLGGPGRDVLVGRI